MWYQKQDDHLRGLETERGRQWWVRLKLPVRGPESAAGRGSWEKTAGGTGTKSAARAPCQESDKRLGHTALKQAGMGPSS